MTRLRHLRERAGMTQADLAGLVRRQPRFIEKIESSSAGLNSIKLYLAADIAVALGCTLDELVFEQETEL